MINNEGVNKDSDSRKILGMIVLIATLMVCTTSATYAFFALSATNNAITGEAATADLYWGQNDTSGIPTLVSPSGAYSNKPLVPQLSLNDSTNVLQKAVTGVTPTGESSVVPCVDANGNAVCKIYTFTICNDSTAVAKIDGTISFDFPTGSNFNNLKWLLMTNATTTGTVSAATIKSATTSAQTFVSGVSLAPDNTTTANTCNGGTATYSLVIWIEEMNYDQGVNQSDTSKQDIGSFNATIAFNSSNGSGITSTITS